MSEDGNGNVGGAPLPPKRTTVIRPARKTSEGVVPARPAPPTPATRPPPPTVKPEPNKTEPPPQPSSEHKTPNGSSSSSKSKGAQAGKKKLEITIVDARPMSEIGFRDVKSSGVTSPPIVSSPSPSQLSSPPSSTTSGNNQPVQPPRPPRPASFAAAPPPVPAHRPAETAAPPIPPHRPVDKSPPREPTASPRESAAPPASDLLIDVNTEMEGPPKPKRPTIIRPASKAHQPAVNDASGDSSIVPPPRPSRPSAKPSPLQQQPQPASSVERKESAASNEDKTLATDSNRGPPKPSRPTIIRPQSRPQQSPGEGTAPTLQPPPNRLASRPANPPLPTFPPSAAPAPAPRPHPSPRPRPHAPATKTSSQQQNLIDFGSEENTAPIPSLRPSPRAQPRNSSEVSPRSDISSSSSSSDLETSSRKHSSGQAGDIQSSNHPPNVPPPKPRPPLPSPSGPPAPPKRPSSSNFPPPKTSRKTDSPNDDLEFADSTYSTIDEADKMKKATEQSNVSGVELRKKDSQGSGKPSDGSGASSLSTNSDFNDVGPVYAKINKPVLNETSPDNETRRLPFQVKLRSTVPSDNEPRSGKADDISDSSRPKPKPKPKPKPAQKPRPNTVMFPVQGGDTSVTSISNMSPVFPHSQNTTDLHADVVMRQRQKSSSQVEAKEEEEVKPKHISGALLARFEQGADSSQDETTAPPVPSKRPVTIIGAPRQNSRSVVNEGHKESSPQPKVPSPSPGDSQPPAEEQLPAVPSKRPITIIGGPARRTSAAKSESPEKSESTENDTKDKNEDLKATTQGERKTSLPAPHRPPPPGSRPPPPKSHPSPSSAAASQPSPPSNPPAGQPSSAVQPEPVPSQQEEVTHKLQQTDTSPAPQRPPRPGAPPARPSAAPSRAKPNSSKEEHSGATNDSQSSKGKSERSGPAQPATQKTPAKAARGSPPLPGRPGPGHPLYHYMSRQPHGIALHDYTATQPDELSFLEGDTVVLVKQVDEQWMVGRAGNDEGIFPVAFVDVKCPLGGAEQKNAKPKWQEALDEWPVSGGFEEKEEKPDNLKGPRCRARFDFEGEGEGELALEDGEMIQLVERVGTEWLRGEVRGRRGIFPASFVEVVEDLPADSTVEEDQMSHRVSAVFDFAGEEGELPFQAGDDIDILGEVNADWLYGECKGRQGQFPASFVSHVPPDLSSYKLNQAVGNSKPDESPQNKPEQKTASSQGSEKRKGEEKPTIKGAKYLEAREEILGYCRGIFDYLDPPLGDLEFRIGDRIEIYEFMGEDWARGRLGDKTGMFPLRFVAEEVNSPPPSPEPIPKVYGRVLHDFCGETEDDLVIKEGDVIEVEDFADIQKNWRWGVLDGKRGMFPAVFVEIMS